jgi:Fe-S cluster assembly protein SufD
MTAAPIEHLLPAAAPDEAAARAADWLRTHGFPGARDEGWRYTPVADIVARLDSASPPEPPPLTRADIDRLAGIHGSTRLVLVNGVYHTGLSDTGDNGPAVWTGLLSELPPGDARAGLPTDVDLADGFQALNRAVNLDPLVVAAAPDARPGEPVHIVHVAAAGGGSPVAHPRTIVSVGAASQLHLIETFTGLPGPCTTNAATVVDVARDATFVQCRAQTEAPGAAHVGHTRVHQAAGSSYHATSVMLGADIARHAIDVVLGGPRARVDLDGLYRPSGRQQHDTAVCVDHAASHGTSTQRFRGVVDDHARGSFGGRIIVRPGTVGNDARQSNRNLVLRPTARADTRPWLEIFADDVRCAHGATVGRLDDDALFYLRSRGIPHDESRRMLIDAFTRQITDPIQPDSLQVHLAVLMAAVAPGTRP